MRVLYQPTQATPGDWLSVQASAWAGLSSFTCHAICVQGVTFDGADHYAVESLSPSEVQVVVWHDDSRDWPPGQRWARVWKFKHLKPSTDPRYGGAIRPEHVQVIYADPTIGNVLKAVYKGNPSVSFQPWSKFDPNRVNPMDGRWVSDAAHEAHRTARSVQGWRTWTEGLTSSELDTNGLVKQQRSLGRYEVPKGTRTYYHNDTDKGSSIHGAANENVLGASPAGAATEDSGNVGGNGAIVWAATTPTGEPNSSAWPTTGVYRYQIDCTAAGADLVYGLLDLGNVVGHFARVDSADSSDLQTLQQDQSSFSGSGLNIASITDPAWTAGAAGDRFEVLMAAQRITGHGNQTMSLQLGETDDFADGPWAAGASATDDAVFFGTNI